MYTYILYVHVCVCARVYAQAHNTRMSVVRVRVPLSVSEIPDGIPKKGDKMWVGIAFNNTLSVSLRCDEKCKAKMNLSWNKSRLLSMYAKPSQFEPTYNTKAAAGSVMHVTLTSRYAVP